ncbi:MAG: hypothetical protein ACYTDT_07500 [Planctomycetota bacterium]|jgi:hypothetical protein
MKTALYLVFLALTFGCSSHTPMKVRFGCEDASALLRIEDEDITGPAGSIYILNSNETVDVNLTIDGKNYTGTLEFRRHAHITRGRVMDIPLSPEVLKGMPGTLVIIQKTKVVTGLKPAYLVTEKPNQTRDELLATAATQGQIVAVLDLWPE